MTKIEAMIEKTILLERFRKHMGVAFKDANGNRDWAGFELAWAIVTKLDFM